MLFASSVAGVYRSGDAGETWSLYDPGLVNVVPQQLGLLQVTPASVTTPRP